MQELSPDDDPSYALGEDLWEPDLQEQDLGKQQHQTIFSQSLKGTHFDSWSVKKL